MKRSIEGMAQPPVKRTKMLFDEHHPANPDEIYKLGEEVRKRSPNSEWTMVNNVRMLSVDMVQAANSGHPGAPMGCAPMAHVLFSKIMKFSPSNPKWFGRDRFVLSNGHGCALQYSLLHLYGYDLPLDELKRFRQVGSLTPGHPEAGMTPGIEVTTGPLGQGFSNAVGLAIAESHLAAIFNKPGYEIVNNYTYCIMGDGCMQEGVASEAASLAGHLKLGKLIVLYDDNHVQIDGSTDLAFTEDVLARFQSYGWHTSHVEDGDNDLLGLQYAIEEAKKITDKPSLIKVTTIIGYGSKFQGTEKVHGAPLGAEIVGQVKKLYGFDPTKTFHVDDEAHALFASYKTRGEQLEKEFNALFEKYAAEYPELAKEYTRRMKGELPAGWKDSLPKYTPSDKAVGSRKYSENVLMKLAASLPELIGGSADLTGSNYTQISGDYQKNTPAGRYIRFGVREHGMAAICNGLFAYGGLIPFCATFLNFIGYAQGAYRLSALSHFGVIYVMTHDSIGLGEDGPTHQPIETLESLRATPNVLTMRPADGNETTGCYIMAIEKRHSPSVLALSRQNLPNLEGSTAEKVAFGAYVLKDVENPQLILVSTGSEVYIVVDAAKKLAEQNIRVRVVSMPISSLFDQQSISYKKSVFPDGVPVVSVEACSTRGWSQYSHYQIGINRFGLSGPFAQVYKELGITAENITEKSKKVIEYYSTVKPHPLFTPDF